MKMVKKSKLFIPLTLLPIIAWCIFYYAIPAVIPSWYLCGGFSDCAKDEYCAPLNHFENSYTNEDGEYVSVEEFVEGYAIKKHLDAIEVKGIKFPSEKRFPLYDVIKISDKIYGVCRKKTRPDRDYIVEMCGTYMGPPMIDDGKIAEGKLYLLTPYLSCI